MLLKFQRKNIGGYKKLKKLKLYKKIKIRI